MDDFEKELRVAELRFRRLEAMKHIRKKEEEIKLFKGNIEKYDEELGELE